MQRTVAPQNATEGKRSEQASAVVDGVRTAVLTSRVDGIVQSMANTLLRTARSGIINTAHDFSCCILTPEPLLLAMAQSLPIHVMSGPELMARRLVEIQPELRRGDAFLHNSPYEGNSHAADHSVLVPVIDNDGVHRFTVLTKGHQADCGNSLPTTYMAAARDVYEEGALIFSMTKIQEDYRDIDDIVRMCKVRIRAPEQWWGDHLALVGAARIAERKLVGLAEEYGWDVLEAYSRQWLDYSERLMADAIRSLPAGERTCETAHDPFPGVPDGVSLQARVRIDLETPEVEIDLRENPDCLPCGLNLTEATARTAAMIAVFNSLPKAVPFNGGSFRRLRVLLRENCCVGIPRHPASCSVATTGLANRIGGVVQRAIAELAPGAGMAETGLILGPGMGVISGVDPRDGAPFVNQLMLAHAGGAARSALDGWQTIGDHGAGGVVLLDSVEMDELQYPILVYERRIPPDCEGAGTNRGAPGILVEFGPLNCELTLLYASDGSFRPAAGVRGGLGGCSAWQQLLRADGRVDELPVFALVALGAGDRVRSLSSGGGGYGDPHQRSPEAVEADVQEGWITPERARHVYGLRGKGDGR